MQRQIVRNKGWRWGGIIAAMVFWATPLGAAPPEPSEPDKPTQPTPQEAEDKARMYAAAKVLQASLDALRARDFEGWLSHYDKDVEVITDQMHISGRDQLGAIYRPLFDAGLPVPKILESGWTGTRIYVRQQEFIGEGLPVGVSYAEYEITGSKITAVYAQAM